MTPQPTAPTPPSPPPPPPPLADRLTVAPANPAEWATAVNWAAAEGWNPGLRDTEAFLPQDPAGFFLGRLDGAVVSAISVVNYGDEFAFLGFYLVDPKHRGQGLGLATWRAAIGHAAEGGATRPIGLDGVVAQQANYERSGFSTAYRTLKYGGVIRPRHRSGPTEPSAGPGVGPDFGPKLRPNLRPNVSPDLDPGFNPDFDPDFGPDFSPSLAVFPAREVEFDDLASYDRQCYPAARRDFVARWIATPGHTALAAIQDDAITGYGVIRPGRDAYRIGPLFADTAETAAALYDALTADLAGNPVQIDVPESNRDAVDFATERGLDVAFETARMYTAPVSIAAPHKVFGVTTLELG